MRRAVAVVIVVAALAALFAFGLKPRDDRDVASVRLGKPMPDFEAPVLPRYVAEYGQSLRLSDYLDRGRPVLVNVWASWCGACVAEAPRLEATWERYQGRLMMIGIDFQDRPVNGEAFVERFDHGFPSVSDPRGRIGIDWGVFGVPETYFLRADGTLLHKHYGEISGAVLEQYIGELLQ